MEAAQAHLSLHLSKYHIVGYHMSRLKYLICFLFFSTVFQPYNVGNGHAGTVSQACLDIFLKSSSKACNKTVFFTMRHI